jgi:hypothetical protein
MRWLLRSSARIRSQPSAIAGQEIRDGTLGVNRKAVIVFQPCRISLKGLAHPSQQFCILPSFANGLLAEIVPAAWWLASGPESTE